MQRYVYFSVFIRLYVRYVESECLKRMPEFKQSVCIGTS